MTASGIVDGDEVVTMRRQAWAETNRGSQDQRVSNGACSATVTSAGHRTELKIGRNIAMTMPPTPRQNTMSTDRQRRERATVARTVMNGDLVHHAIDVAGGLPLTMCFIIGGKNRLAPALRYLATLADVQQPPPRVPIFMLLAAETISSVRRINGRISVAWCGKNGTTRSCG